MSCNKTSDHEECLVDGIRNSDLLDIHEVFQSPVLLGIAEVELDLEAQTI